MDIKIQPREKYFVSGRYNRIIKPMVVVLGFVLLATNANFPQSSLSPKRNLQATTGKINGERSAGQETSVLATAAMLDVKVKNVNGVMLAGTLFEAPEALLAVVLAHSFVPGQNQTGLHPLAEELARNGITALTFDFQGRGLTGGRLKYDEVHIDVKAGIDFLRNRGYSIITSLGVGLGGFGSAKNGPVLEGLITISIPPVLNNRLGVDQSDLSLPYPKLFIAAENDFANRRPFAQYAKDLYELAVEPKRLKIFPGSYHSMELFQSEHASELNGLIIEFFRRLQPPANG